MPTSRQEATALQAGLISGTRMKASDISEVIPFPSSDHAAG
jgi:hypothetical protein